MPRTQPKRRVNYKRRSTTKLTMMKRAIKDEVNKGREVKFWESSQLNVSMTNYSNNTINGFADRNVFPLTPNALADLKQGVGNSDRLGNKIRVKKATLDFVLFPHEYDNTGAEQNSQPRCYDVRMIIAHSKSTPTDLIVSSTFFDLNNATISPQDDLQDQMLAVNKDIYVVSKDVSYKVGNAEIAGAGQQEVFQSYANNDYSLNVKKSINITKMIPTNIEWNDTSPIPTSYMPNVIFLLSPADGTTTILNQYPVKIYSQVKIQYTDA